MSEEDKIIKMTRQTWKRTKIELPQMKTSIVEIKTHTHASMHACTCTHTQEELNNRVEEISRKLGERYKDITQKLSRDTRSIIFHIWEIKRHGRLSEEVSHAPIFWVPEERRENGRGRIWRNND